MSKKNRQKRRRANSKFSKHGAGKSATGGKAAAPPDVEAKARQAEAAGDYERARTGYARLYREDAGKFRDDKAVITVPAFLDERQRRATQDAAALAGLGQSGF
ncbi:MAG: Hsp70 family protein [Verrucomicrobiales bacterium]